MAMIRIDGTELPDPSELTLGIQDISDQDSGRTEDGIMHKNRIATKVTLSLGWNNVSASDAATILGAVSGEYMNVTYPDVGGGSSTKQFYCGDRTAPLKWWCGPTGKIFSRVSFNLIEV